MNEEKLNSVEELNIDELSAQEQQPVVADGAPTTEPVAQQTVANEENARNVQEKGLNALTYNERLGASIEIATYLAEFQQQNVDFAKQINLKLQFPILRDFDEKDFWQFLKSVNKITTDQKNNFLTAYVLFYVFSSGKYPQECFRGVVERIEDTTLGEVSRVGKELTLKLSQVGSAKLAEKVKDLTKSFQRQLESEDIAAIAQGEQNVGIAKICELFWEVFVTKYGNYRPVFWKNKLAEFYGKKYAIRESCEFKEQGKKVEIYAVSYEGKLNKPLHYVCEDCSFVTVYDENTWLAVSADGVGSCATSYLGSQFATETLSDVIVGYLQNNHLLAGDKKRKWFNGKFKPVSAEEWGAFMYFLRFELATEFYNAWESAVKMSEEFKQDATAEVGQFTSTLQFAFGCEAFVACGRIGDGSYFVRKKERNGNAFLYGGTLLDDCISGVTQTAVLTIAHLKTNPTALQIDFFRPDEITDIVISSDGVSGALGDTVEDVNKFTCKMRALPFEKRCEELSAVARACSDYNETQRGSGDDCTLVHVCFRDELK